MKHLNIAYEVLLSKPTVTYMTRNSRLCQVVLRWSLSVFLITITIIIIIIINMRECVPNYTSTYASKQGYNWTKNSSMNVYQNQ